MENNILKCDVCGVSSDDKIVVFVKRANMCLCSKHKKQFYEYGRIIDPTARTTQDKNEYIIYDDRAEMVLRDRRNNIVAKALIDLDDVDRCKQHKWSAGYKKGGTYIRCKNPTINVALHRFIMNYNGPLVVDHINRNTLDNRKCNLRIVTVAENTANNGRTGIYQIANGRWKVKIRRYGEVYYSAGSGFETYHEAEKYRDAILAYVNDHKDELKQKFDNARVGQLPGTCLTPNGTWQATYCINGKQIRESGFPTSDAAAQRRAEMIGGALYGR